eukprot:scaffold39082_cov150-Skeletonema_marinoi.AAC.5
MARLVSKQSSHQSVKENSSKHSHKSSLLRESAIERAKYAVWIRDFFLEVVIPSCGNIQIERTVVLTLIF